MSDDGAQNRGPAIARLCIGMMAISIVAIVLRFWSRAVTVRTQGSNNIVFWWDDWFALAAVPFSLTQFAMTIAWTHVGLGKHVDAVPLPRIEHGLQIFYIGYHWYHLGTILTKISVLAFYMRVFSKSISKKINYAIYFGFGVSVAYYLIYIFIDIFQCKPMRKAWQPEIPGSCLNIYQWWLSYAIVSTVIDIYILLIPMPLLWKLRLKPLKRLGVVGLFAAGYCVVLISIGRIVTVGIVGNNLGKDITWEVVTPLVWLTAEPGISILSICLPSIFSLMKRGVEYGPEALFSSKSIADLYSGRTPRFGGTKIRKSANDTTSFENPFERLQDDVQDGGNLQYYAMACKGSSKPNSTFHEDVPSESIQVHSKVEVHRDEESLEE